MALKFQAKEAGQVLHIPAWDPGYYLILNHQDNIANIRATDEKGENIPISKSGERDWTLQNKADEEVTVSYAVEGVDQGLGFFGTHVRAENAYIEGPSCFIYPEGRKDEPIDLGVKLPDQWRVATAMTGSEESGKFSAQNYDEFVDHPIQMGLFQTRNFEVEGIPFEVAYVAPGNNPRPDLDNFTTKLKILSAPAIHMMHGASFKRYVYIFHFQVGNFEGGLEHRASCVMAMPNEEPAYLDNLITHEYFHAWNVKQIRPSVLGPFDYQHKVHTDNLWFAEGVTDYYAYVHAYRSGARDADWLRNQLTDQLTTLQNSRNRHSLTLAQTSQQAWLNGGFGVGDLSYYNKGLVAGLLLDSAIRGLTDGKKSLDDVMRLMYARYKLPNAGYPEDGIQNALLEVTGGEAGPNSDYIRKLYYEIVYTTHEMPYTALNHMGLAFFQPGDFIRRLGFTTNGLTVSGIEEGSESRLHKGDVIVEINEVEQHGSPDFSSVGEQYSLKVMRNNSPLMLNMRTLSDRCSDFTLRRDPLASAKGTLRLNEWLVRDPR